MYDEDQLGRQGGGARGPDDESPACRRAYYRVSAVLPIRVTRLREEDVEKAVLELTLPASLPETPASLEEEEDSPLARRLRRIEEKLDRLLMQQEGEGPAPLGSEDCERIVFSGSGLSMPIDEPFERGEAFSVELLLPGSRARVVRGVGRAVSDAQLPADGVARFVLALSLDHMTEEDRDALVAHSYDLQRLALRSRDAGEEEP